MCTFVYDANEKPLERRVSIVLSRLFAEMPYWSWRFVQFPIRLAAPQVVEEWTTALSWRSRNAKRITAPEHRPLLWFLGLSVAKGEKVHYFSYGIDDIGNT